ncbi:MAG: hypothetical protein ABR584_07810 [Candidatus Baltobacteraceae bacterium]
MTTSTVILMLLGISACASKQSTSATTADSTTTQGADASTTAEASPAAEAAADGQAKIETTGTVSFAHDFTVPSCQVGKPGEGLLNGYTMATEGSDGDPSLIHVRIADFTKDGTYSIATKTGEAQVAQMMSPGSAGIQMVLATGGKDQPPTSLTTTPQATTEIVISGDGAKGEVTFTKYQDLAKAQFEKDRDNSNLVDGKISWTCGKVDHLAAGMSDAVNGAFNSLMGGSKKP